jgi:hypothetical protein
MSCKKLKAKYGDYFNKTQISEYETKYSVLELLKSMQFTYPKAFCLLDYKDYKQFINHPNKLCSLILFMIENTLGYVNLLSLHNQVHEKFIKHTEPRLIEQFYSSKFKLMEILLGTHQYNELINLSIIRYNGTKINDEELLFQGDSEDNFHLSTTKLKTFILDKLIHDYTISGLTSNTQFITLTQKEEDGYTNPPRLNIKEEKAVIVLIKKLLASELKEADLTKSIYDLLKDSFHKDFKKNVNSKNLINKIEKLIDKNMKNKISESEFIDKVQQILIGKFEEKVIEEQALDKILDIKNIIFKDIHQHTAMPRFYSEVELTEEIKVSDTLHIRKKLQELLSEKHSNFALIEKLCKYAEDPFEHPFFQDAPITCLNQNKRYLDSLK